MGKDNIRSGYFEKKVTKLQIVRIKTPRRFLATSGDKMLTLFEELKGSDASPELVQVNNLIFSLKKSYAGEKFVYIEKLQ